MRAELSAPPSHNNSATASRVHRLRSSMMVNSKRPHGNLPAKIGKGIQSKRCRKRPWLYACPATILGPGSQSRAKVRKSGYEPLHGWNESAPKRATDDQQERAEQPYGRTKQQPADWHVLDPGPD